MFEIDFFKLIIVAMIGLLVLGPEKLPGLAAKLGRWVGRARSMARQFRMQLEQEVLLEEARQQSKQTIRNPATSTPPAEATTPVDSVPRTSEAQPMAPAQGDEVHATSQSAPGAVQSAASPSPVTSQAGPSHE